MVWTPARLYAASQWAQDVFETTSEKRRGGSAMEVTTIGIDLAKSVFAVCGADSSGRVVMRRQLRRPQVLSFMRGLPRCVVGMEASGGAHYWARQLSALGHEVRLMSPALVMPYRKGNKTDRNDAEVWSSFGPRCRNDLPRFVYTCRARVEKLKSSRA